MRVLSSVMLESVSTDLQPRRCSAAMRFVCLFLSDGRGWQAPSLSHDSLYSMPEIVGKSMGCLLEFVMTRIVQACHGYSLKYLIECVFSCKKNQAFLFDLVLLRPQSFANFKFVVPPNLEDMFYIVTIKVTRDFLA